MGERFKTTGTGKGSESRVKLYSLYREEHDRIFKKKRKKSPKKKG